MTWDARRDTHERALATAAREEQYFRERSERRPKVAERAPYWVWEMFDQNVPGRTFYGCSSAVNPLTPAGKEQP
jgi:hypothetical protein